MGGLYAPFVEKHETDTGVVLSLLLAHATLLVVVDHQPMLYPYNMPGRTAGNAWCEDVMRRAYTALLIVMFSLLWCVFVS